MCIKLKANIFTGRGKLTRWMDGAYKPRTLPSFGSHGLRMKWHGGHWTVTMRTDRSISFAVGRWALPFQSNNARSSPSMLFHNNYFMNRGYSYGHSKSTCVWCRPQGRWDSVLDIYVGSAGAGSAFNWCWVEGKKLSANELGFAWLVLWMTVLYVFHQFPSHRDYGVQQVTHVHVKFCLF